MTSPFFNSSFYLYYAILLSKPEWTLNQCGILVYS